MRILIIRTSALGDVVHGLPVLEALRRHEPAARIGWVVESSAARVLEDHPALDELLVVRLNEWRKRPLSRRTISEIGNFLGQLRRFAPEITLDLMGNHKSGLLSALTLCDRRIGAARRDRREPSSAIWISEPVQLQGEHVIERSLSLLGRLGLPTETPDLGGQHLFAGRERPQEVPERFFLVHVGAAWPNKRYPADQWGHAAAELAQRTGLAGLVVGGPGEDDLVEAARRSSAGKLHHVRTPDLGDLANLMRQADLVLGADTGPIHLAHAMGTPVLALMGPTDPRTHGPWGRPDSALWHRLPCSFCHRRLDSPKPCLQLIEPAVVAERAASLLSM